MFEGCKFYIIKVEKIRRREIMKEERFLPAKGKMAEDRRILKRVENLFKRDEALKNEKIDISVVSGEVFLDGEVRDKTLIKRAEKLVRSIKGVKKIVNSLSVPVRRSISDEDIEDAATKIIKERNLSVNVSVRNGILKIFGSVSTLKEKKTIETYFKSLPVKRIENQIKIEPPFPVNDFALESLLFDALRELKIFHLRVKVLNKIAYIKGNVESEEEKKAVVDRASEVPGVLGVVNGIVSRGDRSKDVEIENKISEILKDRMFTKDNISFFSVGGVVFLEGEVTNPSSLYAIEEKVGKISGVRKVINRLIGVIR